MNYRKPIQITTKFLFNFAAIPTHFADFTLSWPMGDRFEEREALVDLGSAEGLEAAG